MAYTFPSPEWVGALCDVLNSDPRYAEVAQDWEGSLLVSIDEGGEPANDYVIFLDLWHGTCREARVVARGESSPTATFVLKATLKNILDIFRGDLDPIQAMLTRRLKVEGNLAYMLRNVPTVIDFVRCCRLVPIDDEV